MHSAYKAMSQWILASPNSYMHSRTDPAVTQRLHRPNQRPSSDRAILPSVIRRNVFWDNMLDRDSLAQSRSEETRYR